MVSTYMSSPVAAQSHFDYSRVIQNVAAWGPWIALRSWGKRSEGSAFVFEGCRLHKFPENSSGGIVLKGTGFNPYINANRMK